MDKLFDIFEADAESIPAAPLHAAQKQAHGDAKNKSLRTSNHAVKMAEASPGDKRLPSDDEASDDEDAGDHATSVPISTSSVQAAKQSRDSAAHIAALEQQMLQKRKKKAEADDVGSAALDAIPLSKLGSAITTTATKSTVISGGSKECTHEVALPPHHDYLPFDQTVEPDKPAKVYPFTLDPFQRTAVKCLERNESVLVSAHTSAGKTVVAEYAIAISLREGQRVIYTSPIKALSNQKYRELAEEFKDVGLMTGDTTINPSASCLVMTTEILRSMLYRGSEVMREVGWVIFDEIHYMRDANRGVVWEETIILLPDNVHYVFLSATIPNALQFAKWICDIHHQPCHVVYTDYRPTPLQHYLHPAGSDGLFLVVGPDGGFREDNFIRAMSKMSITSTQSPANKQKFKGKNNQHASNIEHILRTILKRRLHPCIVFSFSKRECETYAMQLSKLDFNSDEEKGAVELIFKNAIASLSEEDQSLPSIEHVLPLLKRGIGVHHGGLLPILKEVTELLFGEGLVKVLFATETFAMGLNMPAKTVIFTNVKKFDGKDFRALSSGEYIQMSGRAGRRGLDKNGIVILMMQEKLEPQFAKHMMQGQADKLSSAFHLTYNMVLNLLRVEDISPEYMLERSFFQFQNTQDIPELENQIERLAKEHSEFKVEREEEVDGFLLMKSSLQSLTEERQSIVLGCKEVLSFLQPGRIIKVVDKGVDWGWGCVVKFQKLQGKQLPGRPGVTPDVIIVDMILNTDASSPTLPRPCPSGGKGLPLTVPVKLECLRYITQLRAMLPSDIRSKDMLHLVYRRITESIKRFNGNPPALDPIKTMGIKDAAVATLSKQINDLDARLLKHPIQLVSERDTLIALVERKQEILAELNEAKRLLSKSKSIQQLEELTYRKRVLRRLGFTTKEDVIEMKGRVACALNTGDELLLTEMIFQGIFSDLSVPHIVALLSCFVCAERSKEEKPSRIKEEISGAFKLMEDLARRIAKVSNEAKLPVDEEEYVQRLSPEMMDVVYQWCMGATFTSICKMTSMYEGSIIRNMRRLEELLRQMGSASKAIGSNELEHKFAEGMSLIKRDIVFANSLYL